MGAEVSAVTPADNAQQGVGALRTTPAPAALARDRVNARRAEGLAAFEQADVGGGPVTPVRGKPAVAPQHVTEVVKKPDPVDAPDDHPDLDDPADPAPAPAAAATAATKADPEQDRRIAAINAAEKRSREKLTKERAAFDQERADFERQRAQQAAEHKAAMERVERIEKLVAKKSDPVALLQALDVDLEYAAKQAWQHHQAAKDPANPQHREIAAAHQRQRETTDDVSSLKRELADIRGELAKRDAAAAEREQSVAVQQQAARFLEGVAHAATTGEALVGKEKVAVDAPLLQRELAGKKPEAAYKRIAAVAAELYEEHGEWPDALDVITTYETRRREELEELGYDVDALVKQKPNSKTADKKQPARSLSNDLSTARSVPRPDAKSMREHRAETLAMLEAGNLEP